MKNKTNKKKSKKKVKNQVWNQKKYNWLALFIILFTALVVYSNSFDIPFHFDDEKIILKNRIITSFDAFGDISFWLKINMRPFSLFTFAINFALDEYNVVGYHVFNFFVHILSGFFVYLLANKLFKLNDKVISNNLSPNHWKALFVALIFVLHPIQTMGTVYLVQRMASLAAMFYLLSVCLYTSGRLIMIDNPNSSKAKIHVLLALFSGALAVLTKQNAITFPLAFLFIELFFIRDNEGKIFKKYIISGFSLIFIAFITIGVLGFLPSDDTEFGRWHYLLSQFKVLPTYLRFLFVPYGQNIDHYVLVSETVGLFEILGVLLYLGLVLSSVFLFKKYKLISFGIVWFLVTMFIESGIIPIKDILVEHRLYLPMFGFALIIVSGLYYFLLGEKKKHIVSILVISIILLGGLTYARNNTWKTWITIWTNSLEKNPDNIRAITNLGCGYVKEKNYKKAFKYYNNAINKDSLCYSAYLNRGIALFDNKKYKLAIKDFSFSLKEYKKTDIPYFFRGVSYGHLGNHAEAIKDLSKAIELNPYFSVSYKNRGVIYEQAGNYVKALKDFNKSLEINPKNKILLVNRSKANYMNHNFKEALEDAEEAMANGFQMDERYIKEIKRQLSSSKNNFTSGEEKSLETKLGSNKYIN